MTLSVPQRRAVIDVGTNSVKLLVADVTGSNVTPVLEESNQTRLGSGFYATKTLSANAIAKTSSAVMFYKEKAGSLGATSVRLIGTSAVRDALNRHDLLTAIESSCGLKMQILSGNDEAEWVFRGVASNPELARHSLLVLDVGGGSTEFIVGENGVQGFCRSYLLGTVRLLEELRLPDPPALPDLARCQRDLFHFLDKNVAPDLEPALCACGHPPVLVGTSGTASILARMESKSEGFDRAAIEATVLTAEHLGYLLREIWQMPLAQRRKIAGLPPDRADVIVPGLVIYEAIMTRFGFRNLRISTRGLRYCGLLQPETGGIRWNNEGVPV